MSARDIQIVEGWRAKDLAEPLGISPEDAADVLQAAVEAGTVVRLECGSHTLYAPARIAPQGEATQ